ncbi:putative fatty acyl-CoA reductase CG8306 [Euwallacea fornicatus]|uniref:putative fatty acyl-CoA reductase CG8306 n=1 Tax=Euwallacea fornicatus TaxID=995702 RepID=UPI00338F20B9
MGNVKQFYSGKNIFITGATGFVGVCLLEKILRTIPDHGDIYLLMRPKFGKQISERLEELQKNSVFITLLKEQPAAKLFEKVKPIAGDVGQENLGLSDTDRNILLQNVNVIFHSAASLDFGDPFQTSININLLGTRRVTELAKQCSNLKALVHVSSAYVNAFKLEVDEILYPLTKDPEELIDLVSKLSPEEIEVKTPEILGDHPNSYTITKHMAEHEIKKCENLFPCAIVRPSMIVGAWKEPIPGWTVSKNGPQGFIMGASKGVIRRLPVAKELVYDYIPVDIVVNNLLLAGCYVAITNAKQLEIYHCTSSTRNPFRWNAIEQSINNYLHKYPLISAVWYPNLKLVNSITYYKISAFFVHILPAILLDAVALVTGGRPILMKLHRNVNSSLNRLSKFIFTEWKFSAKKTDALQKFLKDDEQDVYNVDISNLIWPVYFNDLTLGARVYLSKDSEKTLDAARRKDKMLFIAHAILRIGVVVLMWYLFSSLLGVGMRRSWPFLIPMGIAYLAIV